MTTGEKPRPTLDETLHRIDTLLAEPSFEAAKTVDHPETPSSTRCNKTRLDWSTDGAKTVIYCKFPADPLTGRCRFHAEPKPLRLQGQLVAAITDPGQSPPGFVQHHPWDVHQRWPLVTAALAEFAETSPPTKQPGLLARALHYLFAR